jgi:serine/threonine protein kinase
MASACPGKDDLRAYAAGRNVAPHAAAAVEAHLAGCAACRQWVQEWRDDETLATGLREAVGLAGDEDLRRRLQERLAGDYEVLEPVGRGAAGVVFKARDVRLNRLVAIKCPADAAQRDRLVAMVDEARTMARISHPNIVAIYALSEGPDLPFMAMEFVDGLPIDEAAAGWPLHQKIEAFRQVLDAVAELHRRGIVHRDLKPGNILVDRRGRPKVLDMGIAEEVRTGAADGRPCRIAGTPAYLAPEQWRGDPPSTTTLQVGPMTHA